MKKSPSQKSSIIPLEFIERKIYIIRGHKVMLDTDLAKLYQVPTKALNQAIKRNIERFPNDFMFQLTKQETSNLTLQIATSSSRSQFVTLKRGENIKYLPYVFTEQGVAMLSSVLKSYRAVQVNIAIMRVFVRIRELMISNKDLARRIDDLEKKYNNQFRTVFEAIRQLLTPIENPNKTEIGFKPKK